MVLFLHISGFVSYSRFCSWGHLLWQKSYAAHVWLWMRPSSSSPWCKLNYSHDSVFNCKNTVYMQRAVGEGQESQILRCVQLVSECTHRAAGEGGLFPGTEWAWRAGMILETTCHVLLVSNFVQSTELLWNPPEQRVSGIPKQTREEWSGCPLCTDLPSPTQGQSDVSPRDFGKPFSRREHTDAVWML